MLRIKELMGNLLMAVLLCLAISWLTDRDPPVNYLVAEVATQIGPHVEPPPRPGGEIPIRLVVDRDRLCYTFADRRFRDVYGAEFDLEDDKWTPTATVTGGQAYKFVPLPARVHPGPGKLTLDVTWYCNPFHYLWPIRTAVEIPVEVHPRLQAGAISP